LERRHNITKKYFYRLSYYPERCNFESSYYVLQKKEMMHKSAFLIVISVLVVNVAQSQDFVTMRHALKVELGLPIVQTNPAFKEFIQGVVYTNINYQYRFLENNKFSPILGVGFSLNYLDVANFKIIGLNQGGLFSYAPLIKIGAEIIHQDNIIVDYHFKIGYSFMESQNKQTPANMVFSSMHEHWMIEPGINFTLMIDDRQGFSFNASYTFRDIKFNAYHLMLDELPGFQANQLGGISSHLNFGFGYTLYLQKASKSQY